MQTSQVCPPIEFHSRIPPSLQPRARLHRNLSKQPNVRKQRPYSQEEQHPNFPTHSRLLRHPQHPIHRPPQSHSRIIEAVIHGIRKGGGGADLVADGEGDIFQHFDLGGHAFEGGVVLVFEGGESGVGVLSSIDPNRVSPVNLQEHHVQRAPGVLSPLPAPPGTLFSHPPAPIRLAYATPPA